MNKLTEFLVNSILEEENKEVVAIYGGGFKPPTTGHLSVVEQALKQYPEISKFLIYVGSGVRDEIDQEEALLVWEIYKKYLPAKVEIVAAKKPPIQEIYSYAKEHPEQSIYWIIGAREGREDDLEDIKQRTAALDKKQDKYGNVEVKVMSTPNAGMSGTNARKALLSTDKFQFFKFIPDKLTDDEKEEIFTILRPSVTEKKDPKKGTGKKPKGSGRRLYTDEDPSDTVGVKFSSRQDIVDTFSKKSFKAKSHARQSQIINLVHQRVRAAYNRAKDPDVKKRLKTALDYAEQRKEASKAKTQRLKKQKLNEHSMGDSIDLSSYLSKLTQHMIDKGYNIEPLPGLKLIDDDFENAEDFFGKTAYYDPVGQVIVLYTHGRHPKDIARSYAHEMIHHIQNLEGRLGNITTTNTQEDDHLNDIEAEANLKGTMTFRNWTDSLQENLTQEVPQYFYHATYKPLLPSIKKTGLDTSEAKLAWEDSEPGIVYLANDPYVAESYAETSEMVDDEWLDEIIILKVASKDLDLSKLHDDRNVRSDEPSDTFEYHGVIPWNVLKLYKEDINEVGDATQKPYNWNRTVSKDPDDGLIEGVDYRFTTDLHTNYVAFFQMVGPMEYEFGFNIPGGNQAQVSNKGELFRVMATMVAIMKDFMDLMGNDWSEISFSGSKDPSRFDDNRRDKLYMAYIKKNLPSSVNVSVDDDDMTVLSNTLAEGFNKKLGKDPFGLNAFAYELARLDEGAYDSLTTKLTRATIRKWVEDSKKKPIPKKSFVDIDVDEFDGKGREIEFNYVGIVEFDKKIDGYEVDGTSNSGEDKGKMPFVATMFRINPKILPQAWSKISADVSDVIRHEIEHLTQAGDNVRGQVYDDEGNLIDKGKYMDDDIMIRDMINKLKILPKSDYYKLEKEVDAMLQGLYLKAKKTRKPFADVVNQYLDIAPGIDTKEDKEMILNLWRSRRKALSLPVFENEEKVMDYRIFLDMDGVLVDFDQQFKDLTGMMPREFESKYTTEKFWEKIDGAGVGFWRGMKWMPGGEELYKRAAQHDHFLLSSPSRSEVSKIGKRLWRRDKTPNTKLYLARSYNKRKFAAPNHILIDDREDNIQQWKDAGGIGILYKSADQVNKELDKLGL